MDRAADRELPSLEELLALAREPTRPWGEVFARRVERFPREVTYRVLKGERGTWDELADLCNRLGLPSAEDSRGSAIDDIWSSNSAHWLLDGCLVDHDGNYTRPDDEMPPKHRYIVGVKAFRFACHVLGLKQRRAFENEDSVPSFWELCVQIHRQCRDRDHEYRGCKPHLDLPHRPWISPLAPEGEAFACVRQTGRPVPWRDESSEACRYVAQVAAGTRREMVSSKIAAPLEGPLFVVLVFVLGDIASEGRPIVLEPLQRSFIAGLMRGGLWSREDQLRGVFAYVRRVEDDPSEPVGATASIYRASDMAEAMPPPYKWYVFPWTVLVALQPSPPFPED